MSLESFNKQPYEEFLVAGDFVNVLTSGETIVKATSIITAVDKSNADMTATVLDVATKEVQGSQLIVKCKGGVDGMTYKITFRAVTSLANKWEIDAKMKVKEL